MSHRTILSAMALLAGGVFHATVHAQSITLVDNLEVTNGAEIVVFSPDGDTVATNRTDTAPNIGVQLLTLNADGSLTPRELVSVAGSFGGNIASVSSVALDPLGRGFGVMSVIPTNNRTVQGEAVFFDYRSGSTAVLVTLGVGFHPDSVSFSRDGSKVFVANEGEFTGNGVGEGGGGGDTDAPGSVSIIDLSGVATIGDVAGLDVGDVTTVDFSPANLGPGVDLDGLRFNDDTFSPGNAHRHVEPEFLVEGDDKVYVSLQENNAVAELSLTGAQANKFTAIFPLGTIEQTIDASDRDGAGGTTAALIDDVVEGIPMPDTMASFVAGGVRYLVTANEGDFRPDDDDRIRVKDFTGVEIGSAMDTSDAGLGRLRVVKDLSDPDGNDLIDVPIMPGTRSFSIWNAATGALVGDTGSLEPLLLSLHPTLHNIDDGNPAEFDARSDDKGPEPEALAYGMIGANRYVFVGMERQGAILMFNVNNPAAPAFVAAINNVEDGLVAPESIRFVTAADSPIGAPTLLVGYELGGQIAVYSLTGEPPARPTLTVRRNIVVGAKARTVLVRGKASANTVRVTVNGRAARGTRNWSARIPFPRANRVLRARVVAISDEGGRTTKTVTIRRRR